MIMKLELVFLGFECFNVLVNHKIFFKHLLEVFRLTAVNLLIRSYRFYFTIVARGIAFKIQNIFYVYACIHTLFAVTLP